MEPIVSPVTFLGPVKDNKREASSLLPLGYPVPALPLVCVPEGRGWMFGNF